MNPRWISYVVAGLVSGLAAAAPAVAEEAPGTKKGAAPPAAPAIKAIPSGFDLLRAMDQEAGKEAGNTNLFQKKLLEACQKDPQCNVQLKPTALATKGTE